MNPAPSPIPKLEFRLLGAPEVRQNGAATPNLTSAKAQALLYYLAMTAPGGRATHTRAALASLLWGDHTDEEARSNLRKAIQPLNQHFDAYLAISRDSIGFRSEQCYWVDAVEFASQLATARTAANPNQLHEALALYQGDFLAGFYVRDAPEFESWLLAERAQLRELMLQGLETLATRYAGQGDLPQAISTARRLLAMEPWREETHRQLMEWLAQNGQRSAALAQYELCCRALAEELAVEPGAATRQTYERLLRLDTAELPAQRPPLPTIEYALVGRQQEWQTLRTAWHKVNQTGAYFVCIAGEAGIGKTRLAEELLIYAQRQGYATARTRTYALEGRLAYAPIADWLRTDALHSQLSKLDTVWLNELARLLPELLVEHPDLPPPQPLTERWQQKRLFEALVHAFTGEPRPLLLVLDDFQWCDPETLEWLHYFLSAAAQTKVLVVGTVRTEEVDDTHPVHNLWHALLREAKLTTIQLEPLTVEETAMLGAQVAQQALDAEAAGQLYWETTGNPLFVVESVRASHERADTTTTEHLSTVLPLPGDAHASKCLPPKIHGVIQARLAHLSAEAHTLAQLAAVVGRTFTVELLVQAGQQDEETVVRGLDELWRRRIVCEQEIGGYDFSHDYIRNVAYREISPVKWSFFHRLVAEALTVIHGTNLAPVSGQLAGHYEQAGLVEQAITYYEQAANYAKQLFAHGEVVHYRQKALQLVRQLPNTTENSQWQIDLLLTIGESQIMNSGWTSAPVGEAWLQAHELAVANGTPDQRLQVFSKLAQYYRNQGNWSASHQAAMQALALAQAIGKPHLTADAYFAVASVLLHQGDPAQSLSYFEQAQSLTTIAEPSWRTTITLFRSGQCLWLLGFPDQARTRAANAVLIMRKSFPEGLCMALYHYGMILTACQSIETVEQVANELVAVAMAQNDSFGLQFGKLFQGWCLAHRGEIEVGIQLVYASVDSFRRVETRMFEPFWRGMWIETLALAGKVEDAVAEVDALLTSATESENRYWNAHLLKLKGDLLQTSSASDIEVEEWYQCAFATARQQSARLLELRAATSLARLWQQQGRDAEAFQLLSEIYNWFTEGFDTADLQEAKALLDGLQNTQSGSIFTITTAHPPAANRSETRQRRARQPSSRYNKAGETSPSSRAARPADRR